MLIRFFAYFYPPCIGGGEVILQNQARELVRRGHEVHVHCTRYSNIALTETVDGGTTVEDGVHVHRHDSFVLPFSNPLEKDAVTPAFWKEAWRPADLLVAVGYPSIHLDTLLTRSRVTRTPLVVQNYVTAEFLDEILDGEGGVNKRVRSAYWKAVVSRELRASELVIADSPSAAAGLARRLKLPNVTCHIGMAVDPAEFEAVGEEESAEARRLLGLGDERIILAPSRISPQKGADLLVQAAAPLLNDDTKVVIIGPVNDEEFFGKVESLAKPLGDRVVIGRLPRPLLIALMKSASVVTLPSRGETVGGVVFEGMYAGATVVVSDAVEAARDDYLRDGVNGLLFPSENIEALRDALSRALDREGTEEIRRVARNDVEERFTWERSVERLERLYKDAMEARQ